MKEGVSVGKGIGVSEGLEVGEGVEVGVGVGRAQFVRTTARTKFKPTANRRFRIISPDPFTNGFGLARDDHAHRFLCDSASWKITWPRKPLSMLIQLGRRACVDQDNHNFILRLFIKGERTLRRTILFL